MDFGEAKTRARAHKIKCIFIGLRIFRRRLCFGFSFSRARVCVNVYGISSRYYYTYICASGRFGRKGLSSSLLWRFRGGGRRNGGCVANSLGGGTRGAIRKGRRETCGRDGDRGSLSGLKTSYVWYKSARFWQFAATAHGQEVDFDLRVDHAARLRWRQPITSSAQFVCRVHAEFAARPLPLAPSRYPPLFVANGRREHASAGFSFAVLETSVKFPAQLLRFGQLSTNIVRRHWARTFWQKIYF